MGRATAAATAAAIVAARIEVLALGPGQREDVLAALRRAFRRGGA